MPPQVALLPSQSRIQAFNLNGALNSRMNERKEYPGFVKNIFHQCPVRSFKTKSQLSSTHGAFPPSSTFSLGKMIPHHQPIQLYPSTCTFNLVSTNSNPSISSQSAFGTHMPSHRQFRTGIFVSATKIDIPRQLGDFRNTISRSVK